MRLRLSTLLLACGASLALPALAQTTCTATAITPYVLINGAWQRTASATVKTGDLAMFGPQPVRGGSWAWSGCGTSGAAREQTIRPTSAYTAMVVYTNACAPYAEKVLAARGLSGLFDGIYGVEHAEFHPKPDARAFATVFGRDGLDPATGAMFEDDARNLAVPHALGMRTVHVAPEPEPADHIHHHTEDLAHFLARLVE